MSGNPFVSRFQICSHTFSISIFSILSTFFWNIHFCLKNICSNTHFFKYWLFIRYAIFQSWHFFPIFPNYSFFQKYPFFWSINFWISIFPKYPFLLQIWTFSIFSAETFQCRNTDVSSIYFLILYMRIRVGVYCWVSKV